MSKQRGGLLLGWCEGVAELLRNELEYLVVEHGEIVEKSMLKTRHCIFKKRGYNDAFIMYL